MLQHRPYIYIYIYVRQRPEDQDLVPEHCGPGDSCIPGSTLLSTVAQEIPEDSELFLLSTVAQEIPEVLDLSS